MTVPLAQDSPSSPLADFTDVIVIGGKRYRRWPSSIVSAIFEAEARLDRDELDDRRRVHHVALYVLRRRLEALSEFVKRRRAREERAEAIRTGRLTLSEKDASLLHTTDPKQLKERDAFEHALTDRVAALVAA